MESYIELISYKYPINFEILLNTIIMELREIFDKVRHSFNNSAEAWNKGLTVDYTIYTNNKGNITYNGKLLTLFLRMKYVFHAN